jgi:probable F420-dependent oxidoreductase
MLYGISMFATDYAIRPDDLARLVEERGFDSLWLPEHTHIPASRKTQFPGGGDLPKQYWHAYDPFVALTAAASVTTNLKLATGICLLIQRDPITTAKEVASLDRLSGGRVLFGIGGGWNVEEIENQGVSYKSRWRVLRERVLAMKEMWTKEEAEYHGDYVDFDPVWSHPKPVQQPHPPVIMGGDGPTTFDRVVDYCEGWVPIGRGDGYVDVLPGKIAELHRRLEEAGRAKDSVEISIFGTAPAQDEISRLGDMGVDRLIFSLPSEEREQVEPLLDRYAGLMA